MGKMCQFIQSILWIKKSYYIVQSVYTPTSQVKLTMYGTVIWAVLEACLKSHLFLMIKLFKWIMLLNLCADIPTYPCPYSSRLKCCLAFVK